MDLATVFWILSAGGGLGGFLELIRKLKFENSAFYLEGQRLAPWPFLGLVGIETLLGVGGALAVTLLVTWVNKFPESFATKDVLWLFSLYVVAGFAGRRILPMVSQRLEQKLEEATRTAHAAQQGAQEAKERARDTDVLTRALTSLRDLQSSMSERATLIRELEDIFKTDRTNRKVAIVLARLHIESPQLEADSAKRMETAIKVLTAFLTAKKAAGEEDIDYAAALYNRAAYRVRLSQEPGRAPEKQSGYDDLERSVQLDPTNKDEARDEAKTGAEFEPIKNEDRFKTITT